MAYRLKRSDSSIEAAVRRIATEQIDDAMAELNDRAIGAAETVHQMRKRCKQLRGLVRLVRPVFADYAEVNARLRVLSAPLSIVRDADVMLQTYDRVLSETEKIERKDVAPVRRHLALNRKRLEDVVDLDARLGVFGEGIAALRAEVADWKISADGFDALAPGLARTYRRARKAMKQAERNRAAEDFHEWRKGVKYHWYHTRLLALLWPSEMTTHAHMAKELGELLGGHHDLAVLHHAVASRPDDYGGQAIVSPFLDAIGHLSATTERKALIDGGLLLAEAPAALVDRWHGYWQIWHTHEHALS